MFRIKLVVLIVVVIGALVGVSLALTGQVREELLVAAEEQLKSSNEVVRLAASVHGYSVLHESFDAATDRAVAEGMACPDTREALEAARNPAPTIGADGQAVPGVATTRCSRTQHEAVLAALKEWTEGREAERESNQLRYLSERDTGYAMARAPDLLIAADADGVVVARVGFDKDDWFGPSRPNMAEYAAVARTELGLAQHDLIVWREHSGSAPQLAHLGASPVFDDEGTFLGSVVVGYFVTDSAAEEAIQLLYGVDVAYFYRGEGNAVSFAGTTAATRPQFRDAMARGSYSRPGSDDITFAELVLQHEGAVYRFDYEGDTYTAMSTALAKDETGTAVSSGFIVVSSASAAVAPLGRYSRILPILGIAFLLIGILGVLVAIKEFMLPVEEISKGVQEVIAGNSDFMWEVDEKSHLSDLAHSLNVMSARLQGKKDPDADDVEGEDDWQAMAHSGSRPAVPKKVGGIGGLRGRSAQEDDEDEA